MSLPLSRFAPHRRDDPLLGHVKVCTACGEEWPEDAEFFYQQRVGERRRYYAKCRACWSERNQGEYRQRCAS